MLRQRARQLRKNSTEAAVSMTNIMDTMKYEQNF